MNYNSDSGATAAPSAAIGGQLKASIGLSLGVLPVIVICTDPSQVPAIVEAFELHDSRVVAEVAAPDETTSTVVSNEVSHLRTKLQEVSLERDAAWAKANQYCGEMHVLADKIVDLRTAAELANSTGQTWKQRSELRETALRAIAVMTTDDSIQFVINQTLSPVT